MIQIGLKIAGIKGMIGALEPAPNIKFAKATARQEFGKFASEVKDKLRANTPELEGHLKRATKSKTTPGGGAKVYVDRSGGSSGKGYHSHIVDKGTKARKTSKGANRGVMPAANYQEPILQAARNEFDATIVPRIAARTRKRIADAIKAGKMS